MHSWTRRNDSGGKFHAVPPLLPDLGIYELDGDELRICWGGEEKFGGRTEEFKTAVEAGGRLLFLKRAKPRESDVSTTPQSAICFTLNSEAN